MFTSIVLFLAAVMCDPPCTCVCSDVPTTPPDMGGIGSVCPKTAALVKPFLWKPEAQDTNDSRLGKPALIDSTHKVRWKTLDVLAGNGARIGGLGFYGTFRGANSSRFYSGCCGGSNTTARQLAERAEAQTGNRQVYVEATSGDLCLGPFDPTKRTGGY